MAALVNDSDSDNESTLEGEEVKVDIALKLEQCLLRLRVPEAEAEQKKKFIVSAVSDLVALWSFSGNVTTAHSVLDSSINAGPIIEDEAKTILQSIYRRLTGRVSLRRRYYAEIHRSIPLAVFTMIVRVVNNSAGFAPPFCYYSKNRKAAVVSFTSIRLVKELFCLLTGLSGAEVGSNFKRTLASGKRMGHKVSVMVNETKDFALIYKYQKRELKVSFHYGEWNICDAPQHN